MESMSTTRFSPVDAGKTDTVLPPYSQAKLPNTNIDLPRKIYGETTYCFNYTTTEICNRTFDKEAPFVKLTSQGPEPRGGVRQCRQGHMGGPSIIVGKQNPIDFAAETRLFRQIQDRKRCPILEPNFMLPAQPEYIPREVWNESTKAALATRKC